MIIPKARAQECRMRLEMGVNKSEEEGKKKRRMQTNKIKHDDDNKHEIACGTRVR